MSQENSELKPKRSIIIRRHHSAEIWAQARRDYLAGFTASAVSKHYGMSVDAIRKRASKQKWCKAHHMAKDAPAPLLPPDDPAQVVASADGGVRTRWIEIAHPAQLPPAGAWSTWLFQGGRGAGKTRAGAEWLAARAQAKPGLYALMFESFRSGRTRNPGATDATLAPGFRVLAPRAPE